MPFQAATNNTIAGGQTVVLICIFLSWIDHLPSAIYNRGNDTNLVIQFIVDIIAGALTAYAAVATDLELANVKTEHIIYLILAVLILAASKLYTLSRKHSSTVFRDFAYTMGMGVSGILAAFHLKELVYLTSNTNNGPHYTVADTTTVKCNKLGNHTVGFLFDSTEYSNTCPTLVWEHVRLNVLFATQLYVLLTLTTGLQQGGPNASGAYVHGALAIFECTALSLAAAVQFDVIETCYKIGYGVAILLCVSQVLYIVRLFIYYYELPQIKPAEQIQAADQRKTLSLAMIIVYKFRPVNTFQQRLSSYKLKF